MNVKTNKKKGVFYETVRSAQDIHINAYNPSLLKKWRANMEVVSDEGAGLFNTMKPGDFFG